MDQVFPECERTCKGTFQRAQARVLGHQLRFVLLGGDALVLDPFLRAAGPGRGASWRPFRRSASHGFHRADVDCKANSLWLE